MPGVSRRPVLSRPTCGHWCGPSPAARGSVPVPALRLPRDDDRNAAEKDMLAVKTVVANPLYGNAAAPDARPAPPPGLERDARPPAADSASPVTPPPPDGGGAPPMLPEPPRTSPMNGATGGCRCTLTARATGDAGAGGLTAVLLALVWVVCRLRGLLDRKIGRGTPPRARRFRPSRRSAPPSGPSSPRSPREGHGPSQRPLPAGGELLGRRTTIRVAAVCTP